MRRVLLGFVVTALGAGCQQDLVLAMGDLTGILVTPATDAVVLASETPPTMVAEPLAPPTADGPSDPQTPGVGGDAVPSADGAASGDGGAGEPQNAGFDPVSTPQGPRESEGVRWDGVKEKGGRSQTVRGPGHDVEFKRR